jgi:bifunctional DNase/RNase
LRNNTFFARILLCTSAGADLPTVDARPSDALALALRAKAPLRVAASVLEAARSDLSGPDPLPPGP